jgi:hypothetical protein
MISNNTNAVTMLAGERRCRLRAEAHRSRLVASARTQGRRPRPAPKRNPQWMMPFGPCVPEVLS